MTETENSEKQSLVEKFLGVLEQTDRYEPARILGFQENVLKDLIAHTARHVPFYRGRLDILFDKQGNVVFDRWLEVPILTSDEAKSNLELLRSDELPLGQGLVMRYITSGSTGRSTDFYRTSLSSEGQQAGTLRHYRAFGLDPTRDLAMIRVFDSSLARFRGPNAMEEAPLWTPAWFAKGSGGRIRRLSVFTSITKQIEWLRGLGPVYLNTFPSNALALARHVALYPNEKPEILAILTAGEPLTTDVRRQCRTYLRCECIDILSNAEAGYIATQCTTGQSYHVQSELCRVEVLDQKGSPARPGQWGRLLITPLYNLAMPLIRYATGDYVRIASPCACGRYHQALELEVGRPNNLFKTRNGRWFRPDIDSSKIWPILGEDRWQLVQLAPAKFEFRYMAKEELGTEQTKALIKLFLPALPRGAKLRTRRHPALGLLSSGKFSNFMREPAFTDQ